MIQASYLEGLLTNLLYVNPQDSTTKFTENMLKCQGAAEVEQNHISLRQYAQTAYQ